MSRMTSRVLRDLVRPVQTWNPQRSPEEQFYYVDLSAVDQDTKAVTGARSMPTEEAPSRARQLVAAGDVLVSTVRPNLNGVAVIPDDLDGATASTGFCVLRPGPDLHGRFLFHWVRSPQFVSDMVRKATGASYPAVSDRIVHDSLVPLPPLDDQRRIAEALDRADELRAKRREALAHLDNLTQSVFLEMFGDPVENPRGYDVRPLAEWIDRSRPVTYGILKPGDNTPDGPRYVRVVDMKDGRIDPSDIRRTSPEIFDQYRRSQLRGGDLLMSIRGHVGRLAIIPDYLDGANITQDSARLAVVARSTHYVMECIRTPGLQRWMKKRTKGAAVQGINLADVKLLPIPEPPLAEQHKFAKRAIAIDTLKAAHRRTLCKLEALFASLQDRAFRGLL